MLRTTRTFLLLEAVAFAIASTIHSGAVIRGYEHSAARLAEGIIALVLFAGLIIASFARAPWAGRAAITAQALALLGTLMGIVAIAAGVGPRTVPDIIYHVGIVTVLVVGLRVAWRESADARRFA